MRHDWKTPCPHCGDGHDTLTLVRDCGARAYIEHLRSGSPDPWDGRFDVRM